MFKTPTVRDLGQSGPYLHSGAMAGIEDVLRFYLQASELARRGRLRNADPLISNIRLAPSDVPALAAFLRSLNEDYQEVRGPANLALRKLLWYRPAARLSPGLAASLTGARIDLTAVSSAQAALAQLTSHRFDWMVIDVRGMHPGDEPALYEAVRRVRGTHQEIPIIVYCDNGAQPLLGQGAGRIGLTTVSSPGVLLSRLIAMRPDD
jgi:CheY-like chemotaxis protein